MDPGIRQPLPGTHRRTRAFIKVQDGCDNFCTFCITRIARGANRSQPEGEIFADISSALAGGVKEIVLSGVNLGAWGMDLRPQRSLAFLIEKIIAKFSPPRIRLSSLEPWDINDELLDVINLPGFCNHLHLPLQSGSDSVLKRMGRRSSTVDFESIVNKVRLKHPEISLTTDVMVGFPGESEAEFKAGLDFVRRMSFAGGHVFSFSSRPGTAAEDFPGHLQADIKKARSAEMRALIMLSANDYRKKFIGKELSILWEKSTATKTGFSVSGLSDNFIRVQSSSIKDLYNQITPVRIRKLIDLVLHADQIF
jgi:threonylcarbamoyladenosine tRNA methylthiotransferase MtaB